MAMIYTGDPARRMGTESVAGLSDRVRKLDPNGDLLKQVNDLSGVVKTVADTPGLGYLAQTASRKLAAIRRDSAQEDRDKYAVTGASTGLLTPDSPAAQGEPSAMDTGLSLSHTPRFGGENSGFALSGLPTPPPTHKPIADAEIAALLNKPQATAPVENSRAAAVAALTRKPEPPQQVHGKVIDQRDLPVAQPTGTLADVLTTMTSPTFNAPLPPVVAPAQELLSPAGGPGEPRAPQPPTRTLGIRRKDDYGKRYAEFKQRTYSSADEPVAAAPNTKPTIQQAGPKEGQALVPGLERPLLPEKGKPLETMAIPHVPDFSYKPMDEIPEAPATPEMGPTGQATPVLQSGGLHIPQETLGNANEATLKQARAEMAAHQPADETQDHVFKQYIGAIDRELQDREDKKTIDQSPVTLGQLHAEALLADTPEKQAAVAAKVDRLEAPTVSTLNELAHAHTDLNGASRHQGVLQQLQASFPREPKKSGQEQLADLQLKQAKTEAERQRAGLMGVRADDITAQQPGKISYTQARTDLTGERGTTEGTKRGVMVEDAQVKHQWHKWLEAKTADFDGNADLRRAQLEANIGKARAATQAALRPHHGAAAKPEDLYKHLDQALSAHARATKDALEPLDKSLDLLRIEAAGVEGRLRGMEATALKPNAPAAPAVGGTTAAERTQSLKNWAAWARQHAPAAAVDELIALKFEQSQIEGAAADVTANKVSRATKVNEAFDPFVKPLQERIAILEAGKLAAQKAPKPTTGTRKKAAPVALPPAAPVAPPPAAPVQVPPAAASPAQSSSNMWK